MSISVTYTSFLTQSRSNNRFANIQKIIDSAGVFCTFVHPLPYASIIDSCCSLATRSLPFERLLHFVHKKSRNRGCGIVRYINLN